MRIIAGAWRGKRLESPAGGLTRPTADRVRQAVFDMLVHAPWGGRHLLEGASVLDAFAGTGALGLEALSRGAACAVFMEKDRAAAAVLRRNIEACGSGGRSTLLLCDVTRPPAGPAQALVFMDPPYDHHLLNLSLHALRESGWIDSVTIVVAEVRRSSQWEAIVPDEVGSVLDERSHGEAKIIVWRGN